MKIYWLCSFPKSGNTWLRLFLRNYLQDSDSPCGINDPRFEMQASRQACIDDFACLSTSDFTEEEFQQFRPRVYQAMQEAEGEDHIMKVHDPYQILPDGMPLFPFRSRDRPIYIVRHPLDVAVSLSHHNDWTMERVIRGMRGEFLSDPRRSESKLPGSRVGWSDHVRGWMEALPEGQLLVTRYEDMLKKPEEAFSQVVRHLGLSFELSRLQKAIQFSRFDELSGQEAEEGFRELNRGDRFFRKGRAGSWKTVLSPEQVEELVSDHGEMMEELGYCP